MAENPKGKLNNSMIKGENIFHYLKHMKVMAVINKSVMTHISVIGR